MSGLALSPDGSQALHDALTRIADLRDNGILTEDEFVQQKGAC